MLESALTILLFVVIALLLRYLLRDYENGVVHTQIGSFRRDENKLAFWFWSINFRLLLVFATIAAFWFAVELIRGLEIK